MNQKTGINQLQGGIVWGVSFALHEEAHIDPIHGRTVNETLAEYHVPVNGEIGITGAAAAIGNAIYNATGKRIRDYPITIDKIMQA